MPVTRALLLTDVVDSTQLVEKLGTERAADVWAAHDRVARDLLEPHNGREIDKTDGFLLLFENAADAVGYALAYHAGLAQLSDKLGLVLEARAGLHVGDVVLRENPAGDVARGAKPLEVEGIAKPVAARIMAVARGGQTLISERARETLDEGTLRLRSHGHWRLKGVGEPVELFEVGGDEASFEPPPDRTKAYRVVREGEAWRSLRELGHNLPQERDSFIGRQRALLDLAGRIEKGSRLIVVLGAPGTGKTRIALRYAWSWLGDWPGGAWFCDLSDARSEADVVARVARALDVPLEGDDPGERLVHALGSRPRTLIVLDNFEQVVGHAEPTVGRWLDQCATLTFVITSRQVLGLPGESVLPVKPLPKVAAMSLFVDRAKAIREGWSPTPEDRAAIRELVDLLDGIPLAIELAASRVRVMPPAKLVERMSDRFALLVGPGGRKERQGTLKAALDWSWELLEPWERSALVQCAVFEGSFGIDAAEAIIDLADHPDAPLAVDVVQALVDKSLLHVVGDGRFALLVTVQEYAAQRLATSTVDTLSGPPIHEAAEARHGRYFAGLASRERWRELERSGGLPERRALTQELPNLIVACHRAIDREDPELVADVALAAVRILHFTGPLDTALTLLTDAMPVARGSGRRALMLARGMILGRIGRPRDAFDEVSAALASALEAGDEADQAAAHNALGGLYIDRGGARDAQDHYDSARALYRVLDNARSVAVVTGNLGRVHAELGHLDLARSHYEEALEAHMALGSRENEASVRSNLGLLHWHQGRWSAAREQLEHSLRLGRELDLQLHQFFALDNLGTLHRERGLWEEASAYYQVAYDMARQYGHRRSEATSRANLGIQLAWVGELAESRKHLTAALAMSKTVGDRRYQGVALGAIGVLEFEAGRVERGRTKLQEAVDLHRKVGFRYGEAHWLAALARIAVAAGNPKGGVIRGRQAVAVAKGFPAPLVDASSALIEALVEDNQIPAAKAAAAAVDGHAGAGVPRVQLLSARAMLWAARGRVARARTALGTARESLVAFGAGEDSTLFAQLRRVEAWVEARDEAEATVGLRPRRR